MLVFEMMIAFPLERDSGARAAQNFNFYGTANYADTTDSGQRENRGKPRITQRSSDPTEALTTNGHQWTLMRWHSCQFAWLSG